MKPLQPLDLARTEQLLLTYGPEVAACIEFLDGFAWCEWSADLRLAERIREFAERLADQEGCFVVETPLWYCRYPPEAAQRQAEVFAAWAQE